AATTSGPRGRPRVERQTCITRRALPQLAIAPHVPKPAYSAERCSPRRSCCYINDLRHSANHCRAARLPPGQRGGNQAGSAAEFGVGQTRCWSATSYCCAFLEERCQRLTYRAVAAASLAPLAKVY